MYDDSSSFSDNYTFIGSDTEHGMSSTVGVSEPGGNWTWAPFERGSDSDSDSADSLDSAGPALTEIASDPTSSRNWSDVNEVGNPGLRLCLLGRVRVTKCPCAHHSERWLAPRRRWVTPRPSSTKGVVPTCQMQPR